MHSSQTQINVNDVLMTKKDKLSKEIIFHALAYIEHAFIRLIDHDGQTYQFGDESAELKADLKVYHPQFFYRILKEGSIGAAEAYVDAWWSSSDLTALIQVFSRNLTTLDKIENKVNGLSRLLDRFRHWTNRNNKKNAKNNIASHYDLSNDLYRCFLDEKMLYSSALFLTDNESLEKAQENKMRQLCEKLALKPSDHLLEIGTGWGAMAIFAASHYGCKVTTTTISEQQYLWAKERIKQAQLEDKITLLKKDYRELEGEFDKIVSIEMIEAVGKSFFPTYVKKCVSLLKPGGLFALQSITIADKNFTNYSKNVDFIQKHIFPGGFLPSLSFLVSQFSQLASFTLRDLNDIGLDYAKTLAHWHTRFDSQQATLLQLGFDEPFMRLWRFYFCYCQGGFLERSISAAQLVFQKPKWG